MTRTRVGALAKRVLIGLGITLVLMAGCVWILFSTTTGARLALSVLDRITPIRIAVAETSGKLAGPLHLGGLSLTGDFGELRIEKLFLEWSPTKLIGRRLDIDSLRISGLIAEPSTRSATAPPRERPARRREGFHPPVRISVGRAVIEGAALETSGSIALNDGKLVLSGTDGDFEIDAVARITAADRPEIELVLSAGGGLSQLRLRSLEARFPQGRATVTGLLTWQPELAWELQLNVDSLAPSVFFLESQADWRGMLALRASSHGRLTQLGPSGTVSIDTLYGDLRGQPLTGRAVASAHDSRLMLNRLDVHWGSLRADVTGSIADSLELDAEIHAPDLATLVPAASGPFHVSAQVRGASSAPRMAARVTTGTIVVRDYTIDALVGAIDIDLDNLTEGSATLRARSLTVAGMRVTDLSLTGRGDRSGDGQARFVIEDAGATALRGRTQVRGWIAWRPQLEWDLSVQAEGVSPGLLADDPSRWPGMLGARARSHGSISDDGLILTATLDTLTGTLRGQRVAGRATARAEGAALMISTLGLRWGSVTLAGAGELGTALDFELRLDAPDLSEALPGASGNVRIGARLSGVRRNPVVRGSLTATGVRYADFGLDSLTARAALGVPGGGPEVRLSVHRLSFREYTIDEAQLQADGVRSSDALVGIRVARARLHLLDGELRASGQFSWAAAPTWSVSMEASEITPGLLFPEPEYWPGSIGFQARADGSVDSGGSRLANIDIDSLSGNLRAADLRGAASVRLRPDRYAIPRLDLEWGQASASAAGVIGSTIDLDFSLHVPDLSATVPDAAGSIELSGRLEGSPQLPRLVGRIAVDGAELDSLRLERLRGTLNVDLQRTGDIEFDVTAEGLVQGSRSVERLSIEGRGTREAHRLSAHLSTADPQITVVAEGTLMEDRWEGRVRRLDIASGVAGDWALSRAAPVRLSRAAVEIEELCVEAPPAELCANVLWDTIGPQRIKSSLRKIPLRIAESALPQGWTMTGAVDGEVDLVVGSSGDLSGAVDLRATSGDLSFVLAGLPQRLSHEDARLRLSAGPAGLEGQTGFRLRAASGAVVGFLSADLRLPELVSIREPLTGQPTTARVQARLDDLALIDAVLDRVSDVGGRFELDVTAEGTVGQPRLLGELRLREGRADLAEAGLRLREVELTASGHGRDTIRVSGAFNSGPGRVALTGTTPLLPSRESPARFRIQGENLQVINVPEALVLVSPDLDIELDGETVTATGTVRIPRAAIELREIPKSAVPISDDVILVDREAEGPRMRLRNIAQIRVALGNDVRFKGFGFNARLAGSLLAIEEPGRPTSASGELLIVDGSYRAYGQDLTIERGRLLFGGGPVDNPGLDVRAFRLATDGVVAGLSIEGTLKAPVVTLYSEPPMAESEALSYLLLGRPLNQASGGDASMLSNAARSLGLRGGNTLARRIATTFGLDEARIESDGSLREASLVAGKYLSPRLYVAYGVGLFEHTSTFRVRYLLSSRWTLVGESGEATSADLSYRLERGR